ncbi:phage tail tape measure protein [Streptomyces sp. NBC_01142]|uniref:phage tail tape measure protein n=1 Tax=Streptomyces sp. NBC_01142 TaxID=2975865 RepID=UPI0022577325|nr:phage tail tape measure protein [Streptomyces sp. NBC_01142]MCX4818358.1 phage tail tape measure protein [Streptomyces sp. NBC_01142]
MVGELAATITIDDSGADAGMARARAAVQAGGDQIAAAADRAGQEAGDALGDGLAEGAADGGERASSGMGAALKGFAAAAVGGAIGSALMGGIAEAMDRGKVAGKLQAQMGSSGPVAKEYGKAAGALYSGAIVESVADGADILRGIAQQGLLPPEATQSQIKDMATRVSDTASVMGEDVGKVSRAVGVMLKSGIAKNAEEAMDVLVKGSQSGTNAAEDLLDTFSEYPIQFKDLGLDAQTAMGLMQQGLQGGARDADTVGDALKEFAIRSKDMSKGSVDAFKSIGLNADVMAKTFTKGGPEASKALGEVLTRIKAIKDPAERNATAVALFGTKAEDLQSALFKLDPKTAVAALGNVKGATDAAGDAMRDNAATKFEVFKRAAIDKVVTVLGNYVVPALEKAADFIGEGGLGGALRTSVGWISEHSTALSIAAGVITLLMIPTLVALGITAWTTTTAVVTGWATQTAAGAVAAARFVALNVMMLAGWLSQGAGAAAAALRVVGAWVLMGTQSLIQGARMAAAWLLAMGPVGLIIAAVVGIVALVVANWDTIVSATSAAWDWVWGKLKWVGQAILDFFLNWTLVGLIIKHWDAIKSGTVSAWNATVEWVRGIPGRIVDFFLNWTLVGLIIKHWDSIKSGTVRKASEMLDWLRGLPGMIAGYFGNFGSMLYDSGRDLVTGLWNGIRAMGSWLRSTLMSWAKNLIPGPIAKALGIHSPSRLMRDKIGKFIPAGIVEGIKAGAPAIDRTMRRLVTVPAAPQFATAGAPANGASAGGGWGGPTVHIENWHSGAATADQTAAALAWHAKGRG